MTGTRAYNADRYKHSRVIGRKENVVLVDFSHKPEPPAPRFPGASGLRELSYQDAQTLWTADNIGKCRC